MALKVEGKLDVFIGKDGYPVGVMKLWDKASKKVINKKFIDIDNKSEVELLSGHSYTVNLRGWINLSEVKTKEKTFVKSYLTVCDMEIVNDFVVDKSYTDSAGDVTEEPLPMDPDDLPF